MSRDDNVEPDLDRIWRDDEIRNALTRSKRFQARMDPAPEIGLKPGETDIMHTTERPYEMHLTDEDITKIVDVQSQLPFGFLEIEGLGLHDNGAVTFEIPVDGPGGLETDEETLRWRAMVKRTQEYVTRMEVTDDEILLFPTEDRSPLHVDMYRGVPKKIRTPGNALEAHLKGLQWVMSDFGLHNIEVIYREKEDPDAMLAIQATTATIMKANSTTYVASDMVNIVYGLSKSDFGQSDFHLMDVPDNGGVILMEHSITEDLWDEGDPMREFVRLIGFAYRILGPNEKIVTKVGEVVSEYNLVPGDADKEAQSAAAQMNRLGGLIVVPLYDAGAYFVEKGAWEHQNRPPFLPMRLTAVPFGPMPVYGEVMGSARQIRTFLVSLFRLMWQRILPRDPWHPKRHEKRQFDRMVKWKKDDEYYNVVHIRRYEGRRHFDDRHTTESDGLATMRQACVVRGHPRDQWYQSLGPAYLENGHRNPDSHRRIWIDAHIRGDGIPVVKHKINAVVR